MVNEKTKARIGFFLNRLGFLLGTLGLLVVAHRLYAYKSDIDAARIGTAGYASILFLSVVYGAGNMFLALAWGRLLNFLGVRPTLQWVFWAYATSQLAKYVPGNVFQFFGRQALGASAGIPNAKLAKSTMLELIIVASAGALFFPLILPLVRPEIDYFSTTVLFVVAIGIALYIVGRLGGVALRAVSFFHFLYLALSGLVFVVGFHLAGAKLEAAQIPTIAGAYVLAWLAGFVTPGAPAGIGIREAVLLFLLAGFGSSAVILLAVVIGRTVTVLGDFLFFACGQIAGRVSRIANDRE